MSSILKALKKLEHEKAGHFPDVLKIDSDILKPADPSRSISPFTIILTILLVFGGGAAFAIFFMNGTKTPHAITTTQSAVTSQLPLPSPLIKSETPPAEIVVIPAGKNPTDNTLRTLQKKIPIAVAPTDTLTINPTSKTAFTPSLPAKNAIESSHNELHVKSMPVLRVNGIAFQASGGVDNMAIVNGTPVSGGSLIEGTIVEEVQKDRVLFQRNGERFSILLGQSN